MRKKKNRATLYYKAEDSTPPRKISVTHKRRLTVTFPDGRITLSGYTDCDHYLSPSEARLLARDLMAQAELCDRQEYNP